jgi:hypothetical protein
MKLCFVSENSLMETYFVDEPRMLKKKTGGISRSVRKKSHDKFEKEWLSGLIETDIPSLLQIKRSYLRNRPWRPIGL